MGASLFLSHSICALTLASHSRIILSHHTLALLSISQIDKIFITHAHGDHCFGLPGLLCLIARGRAQRAPPLELYGPSGLRAFVRASLSFTGTRMLPPYVVHEIRDIPNLRRNHSSRCSNPSRLLG